MGTRFLRPWHTSTTIGPAPLPGCDSWFVWIPGVRQKRLPLANLLAPLRGATAVPKRLTVQHSYCSKCSGGKWPSSSVLLFSMHQYSISSSPGFMRA